MAPTNCANFIELHHNSHDTLYSTLWTLYSLGDISKTGGSVMTTNNILVSGSALVVMLGVYGNVFANTICYHGSQHGHVVCQGSANIGTASTGSGCGSGPQFGQPLYCNNNTYVCYSSNFGFAQWSQGGSTYTCEPGGQSTLKAR